MDVGHRSNASRRACVCAAAAYAWLACVACSPGPAPPGVGDARLHVVPEAPAEPGADASKTPPALAIGATREAPPDGSPPATRAKPSARTDWLAAGGGAFPELNQVSIEQDLALAARVLDARFPPDAGALLFAAGPGSVTVQVADKRAVADQGDANNDALLLELADLFAPRGGRDAHYRRTTLALSGSSSASDVVTALRAMAPRTPGSGRPLFLYIAGHGERGESRADNFVSLWEQSTLPVRELANTLDAIGRPARVVITTCFSGGFAELAFTGADPGKGAAPTDRCGLFATSWDLEASGCDPNPDRRAQEGYGLHFFHALEGRDRDGRPADVDLDGDGQVSLLEAHARVRVASRGIDVPTTTSERWLRQHAPTSGPSEPAPMVEEDAVFASLAKALALTGREAESQRRLAAVEREVEALTKRLEQAQAGEDAAYRKAAAGIWSRWPVLDDPWHPDFAATITRERGAIRAHLDRDPAYAAYAEARVVVDDLHGQISTLRQRAALLERLWRSLETRALAGRLRARGGEEWRVYQRLLTCERSALPRL